MKDVVFYVSPGKFREQSILNAMKIGVEKDHDRFRIELNSVTEPAPADVAIMVGMKATSLRERCLAAGQRVIVADKGYDRKDDWWRISIDTHQPTRYLMDMKRPDARMRAAQWKMKPWRDAGDFVLIAGGGAKYHSVWNLSPVAVWAQEMVDGIREAGWTGPIQYRPKPSQPDKTVPYGATLSSPKYMVKALDDCHAIVTYGSNACFEAMLCGVPSIILGDAVLKAISSEKLQEICDPYRAPDSARKAALSNLAYCQFREAEWMSGFAWQEVKRQLDEIPCLTA